MEIRYLSPADDRNAVSRIYEESWRYAYRGILPQDYLDAIPGGRWAKNLDIPGWHTMVLVENGEYIGTSSFSRSRSPRFPDDGEVISIYLLPEHIGQGLGRLLMDAVLEELRKQGFSKAFLWVLEENGRARRFYERYGFTCTGERTEGVIGGKRVRELRYVYGLS